MAKTILLADDSVTIQKVVELTFMDEDYQVVATGDGASALEQVPGLDPDLVIADVHMPGADGYEVCRQTKATHPSIPVLLLVGTFEQFDEQKAAEVGADGHLKKPFDSQDLLNQVESLIARSAKTAAPAAAAPAAAAAPPAEPDVFAFDEPPLAGDLEPPLLEVPGQVEAAPAAAEAAAPDFFSSPMPTLDATPPPAAKDVTETAAIEPAALQPAAFEPAALEPDVFASEPPVDLEAPTHQLPTLDAASGAVEDLEAPLLEAPAIEDYGLASVEPAADTPAADPFEAAPPAADPFEAAPPPMESFEAAPPPMDPFEAAPPPMESFEAAPPAAESFEAAPPPVESFEAAPPPVESFEAAPPAAGPFEAVPAAEAETEEPTMPSVPAIEEFAPEPEAAEEPLERAAPEPAAEAAIPEPAAAVAAPEPAAEAAANGSGPLSDEDVERIAKRVAELMGDKALRDVAWEVLPDLAEVIIKERIRELESQVV